MRSGSNKWARGRFGGVLQENKEFRRETVTAKGSKELKENLQRYEVQIIMTQ